MNRKIALLVLSTSKGRDEWKTMTDTYLYNFTVKTFLLTYNQKSEALANQNYIPPKNEYVVYIGVDRGDRIFDNPAQQEIVKRLSRVFTNVEFRFQVTDAAKGHVTVMWNQIFQTAYDEGCDYFYQCGDDINFRTQGWIHDSINVLESHGGIGLTGPVNNNQRILTQAFVSRKHMEIFGWFFPEEIKNWCCDDWYNWVYQPDHFYPLSNHFCSNDGGTPRYEINNDPHFTFNNHVFRNNLERLRSETMTLANQHKEKIMEYISMK